MEKLGSVILSALARLHQTYFVFGERFKIGVDHLEKNVNVNEPKNTSKSKTSPNSMNKFIRP